jgi:hypothetical protein
MPHQSTEHSAVLDFRFGIRIAPPMRGGFHLERCMSLCRSPRFGETLHSSNWVLDASHHSLSAPSQSAKSNWRFAKAKA